MAKDVITRFRLETTQYESKLRDASKNLSNYTRTVTQAGSNFQQFTQKNLEAARAFGNIATSSTDAKGRVKELVTAFNEAARAYNALTQAQQQSDFGRALSASLEQLQQRIREAKQEMQGLNNTTTGGLFDSDKINGMLQVFGGNLMTRGFEIATSAAMGFVDSIKEAATQGIEMARAGEGIAIAFERLNRPDLLDNLRQATHGTVNDLELMKQAVKFNDFRLPLNEMGTLLAFAQQKAKDTGQSVDYMVDSIVTGLGRQSLLILDNLGLSAAEIKERMKETGDMTSAVGAIIRDQMSAAGGYVETAADRAQQAQVRLENAMRELGETLLPLQEQGVDVFTAIEIGALDMLNNGLKPVVPVVIDLKDKFTDLYDTISNSSIIQGFTNWITNSIDIVSRFIPVVSQLRTLLENGGNVASQGAGIGAAIATEISQPGVTPPATSSTTSTTKTTKEVKDDFEEIIGLIPNAEEAVRSLQEQIRTSWDEGEIARLTNQLRVAEVELNRLKDIGKDSSPESFMALFGVNESNFDSIGADIVSRMRQSVAAAVMENNDTMLADAMKLSITAGISATDFSEAAMAIKHKMMEGGEITDEDWQNFINQLNDKIENSDLKLKFNPDGEGITNNLSKKGEETTMKDISSKISQATSGLSMVSSGLKTLGFEIPDGVNDIINVVQSITSIINGVQTFISAFVGTALTANTAAITANTTALWASSFVPFANGGVVPHAAGGLFAGNYMSMDQMPVMVNSGELILNRAQQGNLASQLEGGGLSNLRLEAVVSAEDLIFVLNNNGERRGYGDFIND